MTMWAAVTCGVVMVALFPGTSGAIPSREIPGRLELRTAVPNPSLPNDPNRCAALIFVEFEDVPDATSYRAEVIRTSSGNLENYGRPPDVDDYRLSWGGTNVSTLDTPDGMHWIGPLSNLSTGQGCPAARAGVEGAWSLVRVQAFFDGNQPPIASFTPDVDGLTVDFDASGSRDLDGQVVDYAWDFGDQETGTDQQTTHTYDAPGSYRVKLTVEDDDEAIDDFWLTVDVSAGGLVVNSAGDLPDLIESDESCDTGGTITRNGTEEPECTLRAAIKEAERRSGADEITFAIVGTPEIMLLSKLPSVVGPVTIDGTSQGSDSSCPFDLPACVTVTSELLDPLLDISGRDVTIQGLAVEPTESSGIRIGPGGGHTIAGNSIKTTSSDVSGLEIVGADGVRVEENFFEALSYDVRISAAANVDITANALGGLLVSGSRVVEVGGETSDPGAAPGNTVGSILLEGSTGVNLRGNEISRVEVESGSNNRIEGNEIGSMDIAEAASQIFVGAPTSTAGQFPGNRIAFQRPGRGIFEGLVLHGDQNFVQGNLIEATAASGCAATTGVEVRGSDNVIGGANPDAANSIQGWNMGVKVNGSDTQVRGNLIEQNATGIEVGGSGPQEEGCLAQDPPAQDSLIAGNTISSSSGFGINVSPTSTGTRIQGNRIGTTANGTSAAANSVGVNVAGPVTIGGVSPAGCATPCNVVSGNERDGIWVNVDPGLFGNSLPSIVIQGNMIGTTADGSTSLSNGGTGVRIFGGREVLIGGDAAGEGNVIAYNGSHGVAVESGSLRENTGNTIRGNRIFSNGGLGIDLGLDGVTPNDVGDPDSGPNGSQNFPVWQDATLIAGQIRVLGRIPIHATVQGTYQVDIYVNAACDVPTLFGEGETHYRAIATTDSDEGFFELDIPPGVLQDRFLTATATAPDGSTSEFSSCLDATSVSEGAVLSAQVPAGATQLAVPASSGLVGKAVALGSGPTLETNFVTGSTAALMLSERAAAAVSLILARPTRFAHAAGEPIVALDDTLFVSVDKAVITRSSKLPDVALLEGKLRPIAGGSVGCGDAVTLSMDGSTVAQRITGSRFNRESGGRCVFTAKTDNGIGRLEFNVGKGTWNAQVVRKDLEKLTNPVEVGLAIGDDSGTETLRFRQAGAVWTYVR
jgi:PKD repeat protein